MKLLRMSRDGSGALVVVARAASAELIVPWSGGQVGGGTVQYKGGGHRRVLPPSQQASKETYSRVMGNFDAAASLVYVQYPPIRQQINALLWQAH